ncbi:hypothetical protein Syun_024135 [Stephania yunnanensis]|uniref:Homeobox protein knotted-1-like 6 n=1 Tax=Stephania yunnanensis TaxID=152371 RepID=A0AAP0FBC4_9MAGN
MESIRRAATAWSTRTSSPPQCRLEASWSPPRTTKASSALGFRSSDPTSCTQSLLRLCLKQLILVRSKALIHSHSHSQTAIATSPPLSKPKSPLIPAILPCSKPTSTARSCRWERLRRSHVCSTRSGAKTIFASPGVAPPPPSSATIPSSTSSWLETYCDILVKYKSDLARPFDEATAFLNQIETQLSNLCKGASRSCASDEAAGSSEEDLSGGEIDAQDVQPRSEDRDLKDKLLRKYSGYISSLKQEFSKKKKKGKLPKEARQTLLEWWNIHYKWPYPTEADKIALAESTGLDQKQINNWFINQRKRHWKPSENMQFAVMDSLSAPFFIDD